MGREPEHRPKLLMISGCVPTEGNGEAGRVWRLAEQAAAVCDLWLVAVAGPPVHVDTWRRLCSLTRGLNLIRGSLTTSRRRVLAEAVAAWTVRTRFDRVVCTDPGLWWAAASVTAPLRVLDIDRTNLDFATRWRSHFAAARLARQSQPRSDVILVRDDQPLHPAWRALQQVTSSDDATLRELLAPRQSLRLPPQADRPMRRAA